MVGLLINRERPWLRWAIIPQRLHDPCSEGLLLFRGDAAGGFVSSRHPVSICSAPEGERASIEVTGP